MKIRKYFFGRDGRVRLWVLLVVLFSLIAILQWG